MVHSHQAYIYLSHAMASTDTATKKTSSKYVGNRADIESDCPSYASFSVTRKKQAKVWVHRRQSASNAEAMRPQGLLSTSPVALTSTSPTGSAAHLDIPSIENTPKGDTPELHAAQEHTADYPTSATIAVHAADHAFDASAHDLTAPCKQMSHTCSPVSEIYQWPSRRSS